MTNLTVIERHWRRHPLLSILSLAFGILVLASCRPSAATPTVFAPPSATPAPAASTQTPEAAVVQATSTPVPTASPTEASTATPPATAVPTEVPTPDPNLGVGDIVYSDQFDGKSGWYWSYADDAATFAAADGKLNAAMKLANSYPRLTGGKPELKVGDQQLRVTAHVNACGPQDEYGVMFRVNADITDGYAFKIRCDGQARFEIVRNYRPAALVDWQASPAIKTGAPADNILMVWMARGQFHFYINDQYLFSATDEVFKEGTYGFVLNDRTAGGESVSFSGMTAKAVTVP